MSKRAMPAGNRMKHSTPFFFAADLKRRGRGALALSKKGAFGNIREISLDSFSAEYNEAYTLRNAARSPSIRQFTQGRLCLKMSRSERVNARLYFVQRRCSS